MGNNWFYYRNTQAVALKLKHDLNLIKFVVDLIIQSIFIIYYITSIIIKHDKPGLLIFYIAFLVASVFYLIYHLLTYKTKPKSERALVRKCIRYGKYALRPIFFIVVIVDISVNGGTDLSKMLLIVSIVSYLVQILVNVIIYIVKKYIDLFTESLKMDYERSDAVRAVINSRRYPIKKEKQKFGDKLFAGVLNKADNFITENKDSAPEVELTSKQEKTRSDIEKLKKEYLPNLPEYEEIEIITDEQVDTNITMEDIKEEIKEEAKKKIFGFFRGKK